LITGTLPELADLIDRLDKSSTSHGMEINVGKSKILSMGTKDPQPDITIKEDQMATVDSFKYLRSTITKDGCSETEIRMLLATATGSLARLQPIWRSKNIRIQKKIRLMRAVVTSTAL